MLAKWSQICHFGDDFVTSQSDTKLRCHFFVVCEMGHFFVILSFFWRRKLFLFLYWLLNRIFAFILCYCNFLKFREAFNTLKLFRFIISRQIWFASRMEVCVCMYVCTLKMSTQKHTQTHRHKHNWGIVKIFF